jgi:hypothetical protein
MFITTTRPCLQATKAASLGRLVCSGIAAVLTYVLLIANNDCAVAELSEGCKAPLNFHIANVNLLLPMYELLQILRLLRILFSENEYLLNW